MESKMAAKTENGGQNWKWLSGRIIMLSISLCLFMTSSYLCQNVCCKRPQIQIYKFKIKWIKMAARFQDVCSKLTDLTWHTFYSEQYIPFSDTGMHFLGHVDNLYSFKIIKGHKFHLYHNARWQPKFRMAACSVKCCLYLNNISLSVSGNNFLMR